MRYILIWILVVSGLLFIGSVLLMSPKWWIGFGIGWQSGSNEYWSKKSIETTLKKVAVITGIIFVVCACILPYQK